MIGLQSIDSVLPGKKYLFSLFDNLSNVLGYTDGTCSFDNKRYFNCPPGQGYYILRNTFGDFYEIVQKKIETNKWTASDDEFNSAE